ncbi:MAG TPA: hypothetical protein VNZ53_25500 [Steroidobacteraceae bacterium]|nr:hypothetical protein [Steroidobacteraceae bacterium]
MLARHVASAAAPFEAVAYSRAEGKRDGGRVHGEAKAILIEFDLSGDVDVVLAAGGDEAITLGTQEFRNPGESQSRQRVEERQLGAWLRQHEIWDVM